MNACQFGDAFWRRQQADEAGVERRSAVANSFRSRLAEFGVVENKGIKKRWTLGPTTRSGRCGFRRRPPVE
jgi:hypothetical protein